MLCLSADCLVIILSFSLFVLLRETADNVFCTPPAIILEFLVPTVSTLYGAKAIEPVHQQHFGCHVLM